MSSPHPAGRQAAPRVHFLMGLEDVLTSHSGRLGWQLISLRSVLHCQTQNGGPPHPLGNLPILYLSFVSLLLKPQWFFPRLVR